MVMAKEESLSEDRVFHFEPDEIYVDQKLEGMTESDLMKINTGLYKVSEVEKALELPSGALRNLAMKVMEHGESPYRKWGIGNSKISHWVVRMKVFSKRWEKDIKPLIRHYSMDVKSLPRHATPEDVLGFDGIIKLSDLKGRFPFHQQSIKNQVRKKGEASKEEMGCWKDGNHFYVDVQRFLKWISKFKYR